MHTPTPAPTDADLLRQMRQGQSAGFQALYRRHQGPLYRFALLRCGAADLAADVVQEVFLELLTDRLAYDPGRGTLASFLFGVARNHLLRRMRSQPTTVELTEDEDEIEAAQPTPLQKLLDDERAEAVRQALARLAPHYREVVVLYELHDLAYAEIAQICQIDIGTVRSRLARARAALNRCLRPQTLDAA